MTSSSTHWISRLGWLAVAAAAGFVLVVAIVVTPTPSGFHAGDQFGMARCSFFVTHGFPCPGCGVANSVANAVRLDFVRATQANPTGVLLVLLAAILLVTSIVGISKRLPVIDTLYDAIRIDFWSLLLILCAAAVWAVRAAKHYAWL